MESEGKESARIDYAIALGKEATSWTLEAELEPWVGLGAHQHVSDHAYKIYSGDLPAGVDGGREEAHALSDCGKEGGQGGKGDVWE